MSTTALSNAGVEPPQRGGVVIQSRNQWRDLIAAGVVLLILLVGFWPGFDSIALPMDEGMVLVYPELVSHGQLPYRDFETFYGPGNLYVLAGSYSLFGTNIFTERAIGLVYRGVAVLSLFGIARRWGTASAMGAMFVGGALLLCTQLIACAWIGAMAAALAALWVLSSNAWVGRHFVAGLLAGLAVLYRPDIAPAVCCSALPFLWIVTWRRRAEYAAGFGIMLLPLAVLMVRVGLTNVWNNLFLYPVVLSNPGRRFPLTSIHPYLLRLLVIHLVAVVIIALAGTMSFRRERASAKGLILLSIAAFALALTPQAAQRLDLGHFVFAGLASLPFLAVAVSGFLDKRFAAANPSFVRIVVVGLVVLGIAALAPEMAAEVRGAFVAGLSTKGDGAIFVEQQGRSFPFHSQSVARYAGRLFEKLDALSTPGQRLFVGPADLRRTNYGDTYMYYLFPKLRPASYFLEMNPFSANRPNSRLADDIASADWVVLNRVWDNWREANRCRENGSDAPNNAIARNFTQVAQYGPYLLFQRKAAGSP